MDEEAGCGDVSTGGPSGHAEAEGVPTSRANDATTAYARLQALIDSYFEANRQTDSSLLLSLVSDSIVAVYPSATLRGRAAYAAHISKTFKWSHRLFAHQAVWPQQLVIDTAAATAIVKWTFEWKLKGLCGLVAGRKEGYNVFHFESHAGQARIKYVRTDVLAGRSRADVAE